LLLGIRWFYSHKRVFVAGPRQGETEVITSEELAAYKKEGEEKWGKLIPGGVFFPPKFIPGTERQTLPVYTNGVEVGYVDETGVHYYPLAPWTRQSA
jgi:hypothetical protein